MKIEKVTLSEKDFSKKTRRSFLALGAGAVLGAIGLGRIFNAEPDGDIQAPLRAGFKANESFWKRFFNPDRQNTLEEKPADGTPFRVNGGEGLEQPADLASWQLQYESPFVKKTFTLADLKKFSRTTSQAEFRCVEGWSLPLSYEGILFSDFLKSVDPEGVQLPYVALETPDENYYVSVDMESMLHSQTILADQMNGRPLGPDHGEPLRLIIPIKYGIKSLKRIGKIYLSKTRPPDYWAENGYDWYSGH